MLTKFDGNWPNSVKNRPMLPELGRVGRVSEGLAGFGQIWANAEASGQIRLSLAKHGAAAIKFVPSSAAGVWQLWYIPDGSAAGT